MTTTPGRLLRLLSLLQARRDWSGAELAERLEVTGRTVRRDIGRLRDLGYPVAATTGTAGGYRLESGRDMPPLLLDDEETVAVAAGLLSAGSVAGIEETAARALAKLERVLPARLRRRVGALAEATVPVARKAGPRADLGVLAVLAAARRDREVVAFGYRDREGRAGERRVEPYGLVVAYARWWCLVGYDLGRDAWRTFRLDRMTAAATTRLRFAPRTLPAPDAATYLMRTLAAAPYRFRARVRVPYDADTAWSRLPGPVPGEIVPAPDGACVVHLRGNSADLLAAYVVALGPDAVLEDGDDLRARLREIGARLGA
ncbi:MAG TPA: YafY family protein [Streptosporangiaceae bacterium]